MLIGFNQKVCGQVQRLRNPLSWTKRPPAESEVLTHLVVKTEHGKPIVLPFAGRKPQGVPMGLWVEEDGKSEGHSVMERIGVEPRGDIIPRASGQTSIWSFVTRAFGKPTEETKQMTAALTAGAVSHHLHGAAAPGPYRQVHATRCERVLQRAFERLERYEGKLSRTVLKGPEGSDALWLPDQGQGFYYITLCTCAGQKWTSVLKSCL